LGAKLCAIDVSAYSNATYVAALSSENLNLVVCRFSKAHSKDQGVSRLDSLEKSCLPLNIEAFGENKLLVGHLLMSEENKSRIKDPLKAVSQFVLSSRINLQLAHLAQSIKDKGSGLQTPNLRIFSGTTNIEFPLDIYLEVVIGNLATGRTASNFVVHQWQLGAEECRNKCTHI
jgi:hypothetical protein